MKKIYLLLWYVLLSATAYSQVEVEDLSDYSSLDAYRADVFRMNKQAVSSGLLLEYSLFPFEPSKLDGLSNDDEILNDKGRVFELLELLKASKVNNFVSIPSADSLFAEAYLHRHNTGNVPLTFILPKLP